MRLIDADKADRRIRQFLCGGCDDYHNCGNCLANKALSLLRGEQTVDVEPVKHGHNTGEGVRWFRCSECGWGFNDIYMAEENVDLNAFPFYCPNCGAKMDEVKE